MNVLGLSWAAILLLPLITYIFADSKEFPGTDLIGCGGFVEASLELSKSRAIDQKLDYSSIKVELTTEQGLRKYETECAPNGYYFIPVYEEGTFVIKVSGRDGWSFEPAWATVEVAGGQCGRGEDINFKCTGFSLSGQVKGAGSPSCKSPELEGPEGVSVLLSSVDHTHSSQALTTAGGTFLFSQLGAGEYQLSGSHPEWKVQGGPLRLDLGWDSATAPPELSVLGYDVRGSVESQGTPVLNVQVLLFSTSVPAVECPPSAAKTAKDAGALCVTNTDAQGRFIFKGAPCGDYTIVPRYTGGSTVFDVQPESQAIYVGHGSTTAPVVFQVTGFSMGGRVVGSDGKGISGAKVEVDGTTSEITDADGYYKLDSVTARLYLLTASKPNIRFTSLKDLMMKPNMASLPDMVASHYSLCGVLKTSEPRFAATARQVMLSGGPSPDETVKTDANGEFCFMVAPGDYRVAPVVSKLERASGLVFSPEVAAAKVTSAPISDLTFSQARVWISGSVVCLAPPCGSDVLVSLQGQDSSTPTTTSLGKGGFPDAFSFTNLNPGKYTLQVHQSQWCWEQPKLEVELGMTDLKGVEFRQTGVYMPVKSTLADTLALELNNKTLAPLSIPEGQSRHCLQATGAYTLSPGGCFRYSSPSYYFDTSAPRPVDLIATHTTVQGSISSPHAPKPQAPFLSIARFAPGLVEEEDGEEEMVESQLKSNAESGDSFSYSVMAAFDERLQITPTSSGSSNLLFYPRTQTFTVGRTCNSQIPAFTGRPGMFLTGAVDPPVEGVQMTVRVKGEEHRDVPAMVVFSGRDGKYKAGPFYEGAEFEVEATKLGYMLLPTDSPALFTARRLSQVTVKIQVEGLAVGGVVVSLSGNDQDNRGYRKNAVTSNEGILVFNDLTPGSFYLRPFLKEYTFSPAISEVTLQEGENFKVDYSGVRMAYSVFGHVVSLNGSPERGVVVQAVESKQSKSGTSTQVHTEETLSEADGSFRVRGLNPASSYSLSIRQVEGAAVVWSSPAEEVVQMEAADKHGMHFILHRQPAGGELYGTVATDLQTIPTLTVTLASVETPDVVERRYPLTFLRFYSFQGLPAGAYIVAVHCSLNPRAYTFITEEQTVVLNGSHANVPEITFKAEMSLTEGHESQQSSMVPMLITVLIVLFVAKFEEIRTCIIKMNSGNQVEQPQDQWIPGGTKASASRKPTQKRK